jgi:hypothetical protein
MRSTQAPQSVFRFPVVRSFKAFDDGTHKKLILTVLARNLPLDLPLEANARLPNILRNKTCREMRKTLLTKPENFHILNGGIICAASTNETRQEGSDHVVEVRFGEPDGIVNGGHTYGQLVHLLLGDTSYSHEKDLAAVLASDAQEDEDIKALLEREGALEAAVARAREKAQVQVEIISPVDDDFLVEISTARNRSMPVEETGFQNLAGRFEPMKQALEASPDPFGPHFVDRVVWKPNQEVPEDSKAISVKTLIQLLALMNIARYPEDKPANEVYVRTGIVVREFGDPSDEEERVYQNLMRMLPELIRLYEYIYVGLPEVNATFAWADGKDAAEKKRKRAATTPLLQRPCTTKVAVPFIWPVFAAFRSLLDWKADGSLGFKTDPFKLFDDIKGPLATTVINFFKRTGVVGHVGRDKEVWVRLDGVVATEMTIRKRLAQAG